MSTPTTRCVRAAWAARRYRTPTPCAFCPKPARANSTPCWFKPSSAAPPTSSESSAKRRIELSRAPVWWQVSRPCRNTRPAVRRRVRPCQAISKPRTNGRRPAETPNFRRVAVTVRVWPLPAEVCACPSRPVRVARQSQRVTRTVEPMPERAPGTPACDAGNGRGGSLDAWFFGITVGAITPLSRVAEEASWA
jgi:hypothetical protein